MKLLTRWWFWIIVMPSLLGTLRFWLQIQPNLTAEMSAPAVWGQAIGAVVPFGIAAFLLVLAARLITSKVR